MKPQRRRRRCQTNDAETSFYPSEDGQPLQMPQSCFRGVMHKNRILNGILVTVDAVKASSGRSKIKALNASWLHHCVCICFIRTYSVDLRSCLLDEAVQLFCLKRTWSVRRIDALVFVILQIKLAFCCEAFVGVRSCAAYCRGLD